MNELLSYEQAAWDKGFSYICGVDEVGWGPLAGPIYSCAVILQKDFSLPGLGDSKKLSEKQREALFESICRQSCFAVGEASVEEFETLGAGAARWLSMVRAVQALSQMPDYLLVDGNHMPDFGGIDGECIVKGDAKSASIAAASILAKVLRDRYMDELSKEYPQYRWDKNKGYGTAEHQAALRTYGPTSHHRSVYIRKILAK